jgi:hypothetical protein
MKQQILLAAAVLFLGAAAPASADPCTDQADVKKLSGAARTSFVKKCQTDAKASCETRAAEKKLSGAAKNSFVKKCNADMAGAGK